MLDFTLPANVAVMRHAEATAAYFGACRVENALRESLDLELKHGGENSPNCAGLRQALRLTKLECDRLNEACHEAADQALLSLRLNIGVRKSGAN